ncbi:unnamed protein product [Closterium sp. NIES-54]
MSLRLTTLSQGPSHLSVRSKSGQWRAGQYTHRYVGAATAIEPCVSSLGACVVSSRGASEVLSVGAAPTTRLVLALVAGLGVTSPTARLSFTLDSGASSCFFCDCTDLTPLHAPDTVALADPTVVYVVADSTTTLPCLLESLALLPRSLAPPCTPFVEGRQRAAPHSSSFPLTTAPLQTLHLDVWGPSPVLGPRQERYFLIVVDDSSRYTTVFPLRRKADVPTILKLWLLARGGAQGLCGLRLHSDRGGEFSSTCLETFCQGRGIIHAYALPDSPQQKGVAERRIGLVMEVSRTSMCLAGAPQFLWPQAVHYAAHQLNLWPSDARPRVTPIFIWTGFLGIATDYRIWGCLAHIRAPGANKLSAHIRACVFLSFPLVASGWVFYDPVTHQFFAS